MDKPKRKVPVIQLTEHDRRVLAARLFMFREWIREAKEG